MVCNAAAPDTIARNKNRAEVLEVHKRILAAQPGTKYRIELESQLLRITEACIRGKTFDELIPDSVPPN